MRKIAIDVPEMANRDVTWEVLSQQIRDLILLADATGRIFYVSPACSQLGYRQNDIVGRTGADFIHPDELGQFNKNMATLLADHGAESQCHEHWFRRKDGSWVSLEGNPSVIRGPEGQPVGILTVLRDTTGRSSAERTKSPPPDVRSDAA
jgi:PAS domain S-box-containing protein